MTEEMVRALFTMAQLKPTRIWKLPNGYLGELEPLTANQIVRDSTQPGQVRHDRLDKSDPQPTINCVKHWMQEYEWRFMRPAWLVKTQLGLIQFTERKRVLDIDWSETRVRAIVTDDNVTKSETNVHAWSDEDALLYLKRLAALGESLTAESAPCS